MSDVHCRLTRDMWAPLLAARSAGTQPLRAITNGVHLTSWIANDLAKLFDRHLHHDWRSCPDDPAVWEGVATIPDEELWAVRQALRSHLLSFIRERARQRWTQQRVLAASVVAEGTLLDPDALTVGFARRFTAYKRPELILRDVDRLLRLLNTLRRPMQIVFAGKAHPADDVGKHLIQQVYRRAIDPVFGRRIAFVDDYDLHVAHFLVQGCDVWLNNPRKPLEASGTSDMKASINGVPHLSIGDGWWAEGYMGTNGWLIDGGEFADPAETDAADIDALYRLLEEQVVPTFYARDARNVPREWVRIVKQAIQTVAPRFCARRMVKAYAETMYGPAIGSTTRAVPGPP